MAEFEPWALMHSQRFNLSAIAFPSGLLDDTAPKAKQAAIVTRERGGDALHISLILYFSSSSSLPLAYCCHSARQPTTHGTYTKMHPEASRGPQVCPTQLLPDPTCTTSTYDCIGITCPRGSMLHTSRSPQTHSRSQCQGTFASDSSHLAWRRLDGLSQMTSTLNDLKMLPVGCCSHPRRQGECAQRRSVVSGNTVNLCSFTCHVLCWGTFLPGCWCTVYQRCKNKPIITSQSELTEDT